ncbi:galectin-related protein A-like [Erpetoichthys calabaricus]|uniref:Galectin n=1 Tax=Erpetoichthys calabaricus TaxID=27687 RepID=A0A8C4SQQ3_ERPCA|nr:galectin-related protein A-like [Erpetoichthys calabaricus]
MAEIEQPTENGLYVGVIKGGLKPAMRLIVMGIVDPQPRSISMNLTCNSNEEEKDVGLQVLVNFLDRTVIRNSKVSGTWGKEEKSIPYFPFAGGEPFKMEIFCEHQQFRILVDGQPLCGFTHRIKELQSINVLQISGDMRLTKVA